jgi:hypothetical protein
MTFTVTAEPFNVPPRVRIDVGTDNPAQSFTSLQVFRDGKLLREQPYVGGSAAVVFDYEMPFGVSVNYSAVGTTAAYSQIYSTSWANLTGWSTTVGTPVVSGGLFRGTGGAATVQRTFAALSSGRLTLSAGAVASGGVSLPTAGGRALYVFASSPGVGALTYGGVGVGFGLGSGSVVVTFDSSGATVESSAGTWYTERSSGVDPLSALSVFTSNSSGRVPGFEVGDFSATSPFSASASGFLDVRETWLIHPSKPSLSIPIDAGPQGGSRLLRFIEASSGESKSSAAQSTIHRPVGRRKAVVITSGPRAADEWTLVLGAPTIAGKDAVRAIVDDQSPLLLRSPVDTISDLPDDWYSVGDVTVSRVEVPVITQETLITLPLTPVDEPIVRQGALWTYGSDLLANATYADSRAEFPTYLDRLAGAS